METPQEHTPEVEQAARTQKAACLASTFDRLMCPHTYNSNPILHVARIKTRSQLWNDGLPEDSGGQQGDLKVGKVYGLPTYTFRWSQHPDQVYVDPVEEPGEGEPEFTAVDDRNTTAAMTDVIRRIESHINQIAKELDTTETMLGADKDDAATTTLRLIYALDALKIASENYRASSWSNFCEVPNIEKMAATVIEESAKFIKALEQLQSLGVRTKSPEQPQNTPVIRIGGKLSTLARTTLAELSKNIEKAEVFAAKNKPDLRAGFKEKIANVLENVLALVRKTPSTPTGRLKRSIKQANERLAGMSNPEQVAVLSDPFLDKFAKYTLEQIN